MEFSCTKATQITANASLQNATDYRMLVRQMANPIKAIKKLQDTKVTLKSTQKNLSN